MGRVRPSARRSRRVRAYAGASPAVPRSHVYLACYCRELPRAGWVVSERLVAGTGFRDKRGSLCGFMLESRVKGLPDLMPALCVYATPHDGVNVVRLTSAHSIRARLRVRPRRLGLRYLRSGP